MQIGPAQDVCWPRGGGISAGKSQNGEGVRIRELGVLVREIVFFFGNSMDKRLPMMEFFFGSERRNGNQLLRAI